MRIVDPRLGVAVGGGFEGAALTGLWVDGVDFAGFDPRCHARPGATALVMAAEVGVLAVQGDRAAGVLDRVGGHLDAAIGRQDLQPAPVAMAVAEFFAGEEDQKTGRGTAFLTNGFGGNSGSLLGQPPAEVCGQRRGFFRADGQTALRRTTADAGLKLVDFGAAAQALGGDFGAVLSVGVVQLAAGMGPATGQPQGLATDAPGFGQGVISGVAVDLEYPSWSSHGFGPFSAVPEQGVCDCDDASHLQRIRKRSGGSFSRCRRLWRVWRVFRRRGGRRIWL